LKLLSGINLEKQKRKIESLKQSHRWFLTFLFILFEIMLGFIDAVTGYEVSLSIFYLLPIALVAWFFSRDLAYFLSILSAVIWVAADLWSGHYYRHYAVLAWNTGVGLGYYLIISYFLSKIRGLYEHEKELARTDPLTGALNRRYFYIVANSEIYRAKRFKRMLSLAFFDIDNFKLVNDTLGHDAGDELLKKITDTIRENLRTSDVIGRFGGDEFAILFPETGKEHVREAITKIQKILMETLRENNRPVSFSIGVVTSSGGRITIDEMIKAADKLMYSVKKNGKNNVKFCSLDK